MYKVRNTI